MLEGSGESYFPVLDSNHSAVFIIRSTLDGGIKGLHDFNFTTAKELFIGIEVFNPQTFKYLWQEVRITLLRMDSIQIN